MTWCIAVLHIKIYPDCSAHVFFADTPQILSGVPTSRPKSEGKSRDKPPFQNQT